MTQAEPRDVSKDGNASPAYPVASGRGVEAPHPLTMGFAQTADPLTLQVLSKIERDLETIKAAIGNFTLLQQQLAIIERQLDSIVVLSSRTFSATLDPKAQEESRKQAEQQAAEFSKKMEEEIDAEIQARGGDHPPTEEEMRAAQEESLL